MICLTCGGPRSAKRCPRCFFDDVSRMYPPGDIGRIGTCQAANYKMYPDYCPTHGLSKFIIKGRQCLECHPERKAEIGLRALARFDGLYGYRDYCPTHGETMFSTALGTCCICQGPAARARPKSPRALARKDNLTTYFHPCDKHGYTAHYVATGTCTTCTTAMGTPRIRVDTARSEARRAGLTTYLAECDAHGMTEYSVTTGKCVSCFTLSGLRRANPLPLVAAEIAARYALAAGDSTFFWLCNKCGPGEFNARGRKCLRCDAVARD